MARSDDDSWDLASSVGATATMVAAGRAMATKDPRQLIDDPFAEPLVRAVGIEFFVTMLDGGLDAAQLGDTTPEQIAAMIAGMALRTKFFDDYFISACATKGIPCYYPITKTAIRLHFPRTRLPPLAQPSLPPPLPLPQTQRWRQCQVMPQALPLRRRQQRPLPRAKVTRLKMARRPARQHTPPRRRREQPSFRIYRRRRALPPLAALRRPSLAHHPGRQWPPSWV